MARTGRTQARNHPRRGSAIKVEPIRDLAAIRRIKRLLRENPRDLCLFTMGINTAYRAGELLSLTVSQVRHLRPGDRLEVKQPKTGRYRMTRVNAVVVRSIGDWLRVHPDPRPGAPLFLSMRTPRALIVPSVNHLVKGWCAAAGLTENFGSHTLRKTWGYHQRVTFNKPTVLISRALGHAGEAQTMRYLGILPEEIDELYADAL